MRLLETAQNKILRQITKAPWFMRMKAIRKDFKLMELSEQVRLRNIKMLEKLTSHKNPRLVEVLNYDPHEKSKIKRPRLALL